MKFPNFRQVYVLCSDDSECKAIESILLQCSCKVIFFTSTEQFLDAKSFKSTEIVLVDLCSNNEDGIQELIKKIHSIKIHAPIIPFFSSSPSPSELFITLSMGLRDILLSPISASTLIPEIFKAYDIVKKGLVDNKTLGITQTQYLSLTHRERQVCGLLAKGHKNIHISETLKITAATVKVHKAKVMRKMRVDSLQDLAIRISKMDSIMARTIHEYA